MRYYVKENFQYSKINSGDSLAVSNGLNPNNIPSIALIVTRVDSANGFIDCINTISFGLGSNQYDEVRTTATLNFYRRTWNIEGGELIREFENVFLFEDQGNNQFYAGGIRSFPGEDKNTTYRINSFIDSLQPLYESQSTERINMPSFGDNMFINGTDLNGDSIMDLAVGLSTGGLKILYGSRVNSLSELDNTQRKEGSALKIYPNPTKGSLTIEFSAKTNTQNNSIEIRSISGQLVFSEEFIGDRKILDVSYLSKGVYFVTVKNPTKTETKKLVLRP